jgi:Flp pilus assembly protein TadD
MNGALAAALLLSMASGQANTLENPIVTRAKEKEELVTKLRRDIFKVDRAIGETERLIAKSRNAPYLPDLQFRLAELYVEKSRYVYHLQAETRPAGQQGAIVSPETRLLKEKALQIYRRILSEFPDFKDGDKVVFYQAHEQRELGNFDEMLKTQGELIRKYPSSPLRLEAEQIIGDHFFAKADLVEAEKHYRAVLDAPPSPVHDLARYKMGWIRINQNNHADAVTYFEAAAASPPLPGVDPLKALSVKREALLDLVYSYTESRPAKGALAYFEKLSESRATYALALDKLGTRYFVKQEYEYAIPALRRLMEIQFDPELDSERAQKLYDSLRLAKGKVLPKPADVQFLVRGAVEVKKDPDLNEADRKKQLGVLEEMARDLSTQLHVLAQKRDERPLYLEAAEAYAAYLSLFRPAAQVRTQMKNRADALFAARDYPQAARQFEELANYEAASSDKSAAAKGRHEAAVYGALLAHFSSLKPEAVTKLTAFEVADARQALKHLGARFIARYPRSPHAVDVKFNIARAYYEDGEFEKAGELFTAFAIAHPDHKDASVAGNLALDSYRQRNDFKGLEAAARKLIGSRLPPAFIEQAKKFLASSQSEALGELALKSSEETGSVVEGLLKVAAEHKGQELGEKALYGAFSAAREKRDLLKERELGSQLVTDYPKSQYVSTVVLTLARHTAEAGRFEESAGWFEQAGARLGNDSTGLEGYLAAARLRLALGQHPQAIKNLESALAISGARRREVLLQIAKARLAARETDKARAAAEAVLQSDRQNVEAAAVLAEVQSGGNVERPEALAGAVTAAVSGPNGQGEDGAKALWYLGEILYRQYKALPPAAVEQKVAQLQQLEGLYTQAAAMGSGEWTVASLWRVALAYQHLGEVVDATAAPANLAAKDAAQFKAAVKQQADALKAKAGQAFEACVARATSMEVFHPAALGCRTRAETAAPPLPNATPTGTPPHLEELQRKAETTMDAASLEALGMAYLEARNSGMAQLIFGRVTELEDSRPAAHSGLGFAMLLQGDATGAAAEYQKALEVDPTYEKARANLASLRCRFGDKEGAKRDLGAVKESGLAGPDLDPDWKACR